MLLYYPEIPHLGRYLRETKMHVHTKISRIIFIPTLLRKPQNENTLSSMSWQMDKWNAVYLYTGILFSHKKWWSSDTWYSIYEFWNYDVKWKQLSTECHIVCELSRMGKSVETDRFPWCLGGKEFTCNAAGTVLIPGSGRLLGEGHGNLLQDSCLANPMDRGAWQLQSRRSQRVREV